MSGPRVTIIGAGIGGLALAQALQQKGIDYTVYERDADLARTAEYRLHISSPAGRALRSMLPGDISAALLASAAAPMGQLNLLDHRGRLLLELARGDVADEFFIARRALRTILLRGVEHNVVFGSEFERYEDTDAGTTLVHLADGRDATTDVLVGADGGGSRVRAQLLGGDGRTPTGVLVIAGRTPLNSAAVRNAPAALAKGPAFLAGPRGRSLFLTIFDPNGRPAAPDVPARTGNGAPISDEGFLMWAFGAQEDRLPIDPRQATAEQRQQLVLEQLSGWSPSLRTLVEACDVGSINAFPFSFAQRVDPWDDGAVTLLGDAIHVMPATGGVGASTAILDAVDLAEEISDAGDQRATICDALRRYEAGMLSRGFAAVDMSMKPLIWQARLSNPVAYRLATLIGPTVARRKLARRSRAGAAH
jgi:salicylate hydroxylase